MRSAATSREKKSVECVRSAASERLVSVCQGVACGETVASNLPLLFVSSMRMISGNLSLYSRISSIAFSLNSQPDSVLRE
jgi:hypothetical protein